MSRSPSSLARAAVLALGLVGVSAWAADAQDDPKSSDSTEPSAGAEAGAEGGESPEDLEDTVTGKRADRSAKGAKTAVAVDEEELAAFGVALDAHAGKALPPIAYLAGGWLKVPPEFIQTCRDGLEKIFQRDYKGAKKQFDKMAVDYRGWGVGPVGQVLVWQAMMLENFDFKYESQYQVSHRRARMELEEALAMPGNEAWENFLMAGILGIESIHLMRQEEYVKAINRGYEAMKAVKRTQELAPEFTDINLGDGLFNYWVSVVSQNTSMIPNMADKREIGIQQLMMVERTAVFLRPPATLSLTFTWVEEGKKREALKSGLRNYRKYPDNIINNQVLGRVYMYNRMYEDSERIFKQVLTVDPKNQRVNYYMARLYLRWNKLPKAEASLKAYLAFTDIDAVQRSQALYYYGSLEARRKNLDAAEKYWKEAWKLGKSKQAKRRLDRLKEKRAKSKNKGK
jgi:tetratricopeptide (TPR) repeat protein